MDGFQTTSEIVDLTITGGNMCENWQNFPLSIVGATGGIIGNTIMICGGGNSDECYSLTSQEATLVTHMSVERRYASSIVLDETTLWVTGGNGYAGFLSSTENVTMAGTTPGPDMPMALLNHAMAAINRTMSMVIGGGDGEYFTYSYASTFYFHHSEGEWTNGPSLIQARKFHAAGIVTDEVTKENFVVVTGGLDYSDYLDSTEILRDGKWDQGKINDCFLLDIFDFVDPGSLISPHN